MAHTPQKLPVWHYDTIRHHWIPRDPAAFPYRNPKGQQTLRVLTYNIWFDRKNQPLRFENLSAILEHSNAHIICLQEVTNVILKELTSKPWVQERYSLSDIDGRTFVNGPKPYGVLMLIDHRLDLRQLMSFPFRTKHGRQLLLANIQLRTETLLIGTVHLESQQKRSAFRSQQLQICQAIFNRYAKNRPNVTRLLIGDFNFDSHWPENAIQMKILRKWIDLWLRLKGPNNPGLTHRNVRFDRIMFQSSRILPIGIHIIGNKPIRQVSSEGILANIFDIFSSNKKHSNTELLFPSDHFGLIADFDLRYI